MMGIGQRTHSIIYVTNYRKSAFLLNHVKYYIIKGNCGKPLRNLCKIRHGLMRRDN